VVTVVGAEDVVTHQPSGCASGENVAGKMLLPQHSGQADSSGRCIEGGADPRGSIFAGEAGGSRPRLAPLCDEGKRCVDASVALEEAAAIAIGEGRSRQKMSFMPLLDDNSVDEALSARMPASRACRVLI